MKKKDLITWWKTNFGIKEVKRINEAIENHYISQGPLTEELEKKIAKLINTPYIVLTTNGSTALLMALIACGVRPGDEVIVPNVTFRATAQAPLLLGAELKLVDVENNRPIIDVNKIEAAITKKTKVIVPVHLNGRAANIKQIKQFATKLRIAVIEDATQALCSQNSFGYLGTQSEMGVFSLAVTKLITTGQGGFIATKNKKTWERLRRIRNYGISNCKVSSTTHDTLGFNFKFNDILAAIGLSQIQKIKEHIKILKEIFNFYKKELENIPNISIIDVNIEDGEIPLYAEALCLKRDKVISLLKEKNIQAKAFDSPLCTLFNVKRKEYYPYSERYTKYGIILPSGPGNKNNLSYVTSTLHNIRSNTEA